MKTPRERAHGLRWRARATRRLWSRGAAPNMQFLEPEPAPAEAPEPPPQPAPEPCGSIDSPQPETRIEADAFVIFGWAVFPSGPPTRVEAWLGDTPLGPARIGMPRPDVVAEIDLPGAAEAGFELIVDVRSLSASAREGELRLRVIARGPGGERLALGPVAFSLAAPPREPSPASLPRAFRPGQPRGDGGGRRTLVFTHQLHLGGAQLYLMDLLGELRRRGAVEPTVVSAVDGPLREELEATGIPVHICGPTPMDDLSAHLGRVEELAAWARPGEFELALVNTVTGATSPGAEAAVALEIPMLWAIHESMAPAVAWAGAAPGVIERTERALGEAAFAIFEAEATQRLYEPPIDPRRCRTLPYGLDLHPIDRARAGFDRDAAKRRAGIPANARVVLCLGSVEPRKAQIPLAQAFDAIAERHPDAYLAIVGAGDDVYSDVLEGRIEESPWRERIKLVATTRDVQPWFGIADLLVCASDIESLPRTVLEAMAWETPVLATEVFGLPELIEHGKTGWLCEPRDTARLAAALDKALAAPAELRAAIGGNARALVERRHSLPRYGEEVSRLIEDAVGSARDGARLGGTVR